MFTAIADRPVSLDGRMGYIETLPIRNYDTGYIFKDSSPSIYRDYWINRALSTNNETLSNGIFRMLATSGDLAYLTVFNTTKNTRVSVGILNDILGVDKNTARTLLLKKYHLDQQNVEAILYYTHPDNPRPWVLVTTDGMLDTGKDILKSGEWDFNKVQGVNYTYSVYKFNITNDIINTNWNLL